MIDFPAPRGLRHVLLLDGKGGASEFDWDKVNTWSPTQGCLWLHFNFEDAEVAEWLHQHSGLSELSADALLSGETRPRSQALRDELLLALRGVNLNPGSDPEDMVSIRLWTDGKRVISTRRRHLLSTSDVCERLEAGDGAVDAGELIVDLIDRIVMRMSDTVDNFQLRLREISDRQIRHLEDIDAVRERAALAQEELQSRVAEQMNERMYVLSIVAAIFLPLGFFTGLLGVNVGGIPGIENPQAFWVVVGLCVGLMLFLAALFRWKKWL